MMINMTKKFAIIQLILFIQGTVVNSLCQICYTTIWDVSICQLGSSKSLHMFGNYTMIMMMSNSTTQKTCSEWFFLFCFIEKYAFIIVLGTIYMWHESIIKKM